MDCVLSVYLGRAEHIVFIEPPLCALFSFSFILLNQPHELFILSSAFFSSEISTRFFHALCFFLKVPILFIVSHMHSLTICSIFDNSKSL